MADDRLATTLCGVPLRNPVLAASGTCGYGIEFRDMVDWSSVGGLIVKGLSREPMAGNPEPRFWETEGGIASGEDAAEFLVAGATAVQVGTASFWDPGATARIAKQLGRFLRDHQVARVADIVGTLQLGG